SRPPMTTGMSARSPAICSKRALSSARSGEPGAYDFTGSLTGGGTRRIPVNAESSVPSSDGRFACAESAATSNFGLAFAVLAAERLDRLGRFRRDGLVGAAIRILDARRATRKIR